MSGSSRRRGVRVRRQGAAAKPRARRTRALSAVEEERQRLRDVLNQLPAYLVLLSPDYRVPLANRFFEERFGKAGGRRCYEYLFQRTEPCENCESFTPFKTGAPHRWEWTGPDGRTYDIYDFPFNDTDGSPLVMEVGLDVTEVRQAERELRTAHEELAARAEQLRLLAGQLTLAEQRERRRMAKLLHDHLQQLLVGARLRTAMLGRIGDSRVSEAAAQVEALLDESIQASRSLTAELSPPISHEGGLAAGLEWLARWMADKHGLAVDLSVAEPLPPVPEDVRVLLFESLRELLFNAVKHAHAGRVAVSLGRLDGGTLQITVSDSGPGFEPAALQRIGGVGGGFGLFSIRERLSLVGGRVEIDSAAGRGSRVTLVAPLHGRAPAA